MAGKSADASGVKRPILIFGAGTPWVEALAAALARQGRHVEAIALYDIRTLVAKRASDDRPENATLGYTTWVFPPGYAGLFAFAFAPLLRLKLAIALRSLAKRAVCHWTEIWVIATYPWFIDALRQVKDERLLYYNLDDYTRYRPSREKKINDQESKLIRRAALTFCLSHYQTERFKKRFPSQAAKIRHLPLGVLEEGIAGAAQSINTEPTVGYIGNLNDRVDWMLVKAVAENLPQFTFAFVGRLDNSASGRIKDWKRHRAAAFALDNVRHIAPVAQHMVASYYRSFTINWIPYAGDHPFNQASCPTKIMDGLASGRPLISTDIPECRLYSTWISIIRSAPEAVRVIQQTYLAQRENTFANEGRRQLDFVRLHTWSKRAEALESWLALVTGG